MIVPTHRFPEFQQNIKSLKVSDVAKVTSGGTPSRQKSSYWNGDIPWVTTSLISFNRITEALEYISEEGLANSAAKLFPKGTLIMALYGQGITRGKVAILDFEATTNQACAALLIQRDDIETNFLFYELQRRYDELRNLSNDGGQKNLSGELVKNLRITLPTLPEQRKIADFLTAVDGRIGQLIQKKALLEDYKKGVMQQLFTQDIRFKDDQGNAFPEWEEKKLEEIYSYITTNSLSRDNLNYESGDVFNIHYGDIHTKFRSHFYLSKENVPFLNSSAQELRIKDECYLREGDIVLADASEDYADIGKAIEILDTEDQQIVAGLHTYILRPDNSQMAEGFGAYLMQARPTRLEVMRVSQGTKVLGLPKGYLSAIMLKAPHPCEQTKIADFLSAIDRKIESVANQITETQTFKRGLLQQMFV